LRRQEIGKIFQARKIMSDTQAIKEAIEPLDQDLIDNGEIQSMAFDLTIQLALERLIPYEC
jgi:hypothetical protein